MDLLERVTMFDSWIDVGAPEIFWISGFFFTQSFFTGVLQNYARQNGVSIDKLEFRHEVLREKDHPTEAPMSGCYIQGAYLDGAGWDDFNHCLEESKPKVIYVKMPIIQFIPYVVENTEQSDQMSDDREVEEIEMSPIQEPSKIAEKNISDPVIQPIADGQNEQIDPQTVIEAVGDDQ